MRVPPSCRHFAEPFYGAIYSSAEPPLGSTAAQCSKSGKSQWSVRHRLSTHNPEIPGGWGGSVPDAVALVRPMPCGGLVEKRSRMAAGSGADCLKLIIREDVGKRERRDRKSTRLNSSHPSISYAVFC